MSTGRDGVDARRDPMNIRAILLSKLEFCRRYSRYPTVARVYPSTMAEIVFATGHLGPGPLILAGVTFVEDEHVEPDALEWA